MEFIAIGFLFGIAVCFVIAGAGMYYAERMASKNERKGDRDDKDTVYQGKDDQV